MRGLIATAFGITLGVGLAGPTASVADSLPPQVLRRLTDCPAHAVEKHWPHAEDVKHWGAGGTDLFIVRCESAGDDEYYAAVTQTGRKVRRQSFPVFEDDRMLPDVVDVEARPTLLGCSA